MKTRKFWPLDYDPEGEIYETLVWDLPGFRRQGKAPRPRMWKPSTGKIGS